MKKYRSRVKRGAQQVKKYVNPTFRYQRIAWPITALLAHYVRETPIWRFAEPARVAYRIIVPLFWMRTSTNAWDRLGTFLTCVAFFAFAFAMFCLSWRLSLIYVLKSL